jgi:hypothetical protein
MRCPVCQAENAGATCRRCKADLALLVKLEEARRSELALAHGALAAGAAALALGHAEAAHRLRADADSWRCLATAFLLERNFAQALACRAHARAV